jgi:DNA (cytosine-5)-methyltransferase 1
VQSRIVCTYYGTERGRRSLDKPLGTVRTRAAHAVVVGDRMRMLTLAEGRRAMGFPADYVLPSNLKDAWMLLGNAVVPAVGEGIGRGGQAGCLRVAPWRSASPASS